MSCPDKKTILFAFRGDPMCFVHVLLNALDLNKKGKEGKIVIEGEAVKLVGQISKKEHFLFQLYQKVKDQKLIVAVCKACSAKLGATEAVEAEGLPLVGDMSGHPSMEKYIEAGYQIITF